MRKAETSIKRDLTYIAVLLLANMAVGAIAFWEYDSSTKSTTGQVRSASSLVTTHTRLADIAGLEQISQLIAPGMHQSRYSVITLLDDYETTCPGAYMLEGLKSLYKRHSNSVHLVIVSLGKDFTDTDFENFKQVLVFQLSGVEFQVVKADERLANWWNQSMRAYGKSQPREMMLIIDPRGRIVEVIDRYNLTEIDRLLTHFPFRETR